MVPTDKQTDNEIYRSVFGQLEIHYLWSTALDKVTLVKASRTVKQIVFMHRQLTMNSKEKVLLWMRIESMSQFQMRLLKRLSNVINMFGASLHCLTRTEMPWWAMDQMWTGGNTIERDLCKKTKQPKHMAMSYQPLLTGSWFLAALAAPYLPFLLTDSWFRIQSHPDSQCLTEMRPGLDRQDVMRRRRKRWRRRRSTSWGTCGPLTLKMFLPQWQMTNDRLICEPH